MKMVWVLLLITVLAVVEATPPGIANNPSHASCKKKEYKECHNLVHVCPKFCPDSCHVECASCKPICGPEPPEVAPPTPVAPPPTPVTPSSTPVTPSPPPTLVTPSPPPTQVTPPPTPVTPPPPSTPVTPPPTPSPVTPPPTPVKPSPPPTPVTPPPTPVTPPPPPSPMTPPPTPVTPSPPPTPVTPPPTPVTPSPPPTPVTPSPPPTPVITPPTPVTPSPPPTPATLSPPPPFYPPTTSPSPPPTTTSPPSPDSSPPTTLPVPTPPTLTPPSSPSPPTTTSPPSPDAPPPTTPPVATPPTSTPPSSPSPPDTNPPPTLTPTSPTPSSPPYNTPPSTPPTTTPPPSLSPPDYNDEAAGRRKRCRNRNYPQCYGVQHVCPSSCPRTCKVDCVTCKPVCSCDKPGAVCQDPRFIGGDGITFYFHGKKDKNFCLVTDPNLHINAHFIGKRNDNMNRDFTWVQSIGILFGSHRLFLGAQKTAIWDSATDRLALSFDGEPIVLPTNEGATWQPQTPTSTVVKRDGNTNSVTIEVDGLFKISAKVVPITKRESDVHNYGITDDDCFAHLELGFQFYSVSGKMDGVLGQTYRSGYVSRAKMGVAMPVLGGERAFKVSNLFATDCSVSQFEAGKAQSVSGIDLELPSMKCGSGIGGRGVVCKR